MGDNEFQAVVSFNGEAPPSDTFPSCAAMVEILKCNSFSVKSNVLAVKLTNNVKVALENIKFSCLFICLDISKYIVSGICVFISK